MNCIPLVSVFGARLDCFNVEVGQELNLFKDKAKGGYGGREKKHRSTNQPSGTGSLLGLYLHF
jgi:hypothetical protein